MCEGPSRGLHSLGAAVVLFSSGNRLRVAGCGWQRQAPSSRPGALRTSCPLGGSRPLRRHQSPRPKPHPAGGAGESRGRGIPPLSWASTRSDLQKHRRSLQGRGRWGPQGSTAGLCDLRPVHVCLCALPALLPPRKPWLGPWAGGGFLGRMWGYGPLRPEQGARAGTCPAHTHRTPRLRNSL